jgi:DNA-binding HxlR family transcriptional regulator
VLRGNLRSECLQRETGKSSTTSLTAHLKALEQKEANPPKRSRWQEIVKLRAEINQMERKRTIQRINKTRSWFFDRINEIDEPLARLTRGYREVSKLTKSEMKMEI